MRKRMKRDERKWTDLLADGGELVVLELLKRLFNGEITDDTRGVDHAGAEEPEQKTSD